MKGSTKDIKIASFENLLNKVVHTTTSEYLWRYEVQSLVHCVKFILMCVSVLNIKEELFEALIAFGSVLTLFSTHLPT